MFIYVENVYAIYAENVYDRIPAVAHHPVRRARDAHFLIISLQFFNIFGFFFELWRFSI